MKRYMAFLLVLISAGTGLRALEVLPISDDVIKATIQELQASDSARFKVRLLALSAVFGTAGYYLWRWNVINNESAAEQRRLAKELEGLKKKVEGLKPAETKEGEKKEKEEEKPEPAEKPKDPWYKRFGNGIKETVYSLPSGLYSSGKNMLGLIATNIILSRANLPFARFINPLTRRVSDYLILSHTITWFIEKKINLHKTITQLIQWIDEDKNTIVSLDTSKEEIALKMNALVRDVENILGFMCYVTAQLPDEAGLEVDYSKNIQERIRKSIEPLSKRVNDFVNASYSQAEYGTASFALGIGIKGTLFSLINDLQDFESVQKAAGYDDGDEPKPTFKQLRRLIKPQDNALDKEKIRKMIGKEVVGMFQNASPFGAFLGA